jgi:hypothetical protein
MLLHQINPHPLLNNEIKQNMCPTFELRLGMNLTTKDEKSYNSLESQHKVNLSIKDEKFSNLFESQHKVNLITKDEKCYNSIKSQYHEIYSDQKQQKMNSDRYKTYNNQFKLKKKKKNGFKKNDKKK